MPKPIKKDIIAEPPKEQSGNGTPTTGIIPVTIPTLTKTLKKKLDVKLIPKIFEKKFLDSRLNLIDHKTNTIYKKNNTIMPNKPNSSPNTEKIKSVCISGINCKWLWVPSR